MLSSAVVTKEIKNTIFRCCFNIEQQGTGPNGSQKPPTDPAGQGK
ncbi:hypothetical protein GWI33_012377, partial [Rhynchophorus ferrugineus]